MIGEETRRLIWNQIHSRQPSMQLKGNSRLSAALLAAIIPE